MKIKYLLMILSLFLMSCDAVINYMAFFPDVTDTAVSESIPAGVKEIYINTEDKEKLQCFLVSNTSSKKLAIYFHGNAGNIYQRLPELIALSETGLNVLGVGYRGYGKSSGKPSEKGIYKDGLASLKFALEKMKYPLNKIFVFGRSIGTAAAVNTSIKKELAGIILITPMTNGKDFAKAHGFGPLSVIAGDSFDNLSKCEDIKIPALIIHGDKDEVIPWALGESLFKAMRSPKKMVTIKGGYHNDLEYENSQLYWDSIAAFVKLNGNH